MLLALAGVTGVGKSYYKDKIIENFNFQKIKIITTRAIRTGEKNNEDKIFVTYDELQRLKNTNSIAYEFEMLGNFYAYSKDELFSTNNTVFELHYDTIFDFKKICPHMRSIYIFPNDINMAKEKTIQRNLDSITEKKRLAEIDEHFNRINLDINLRQQFDYFFYNNYDKASDNNFLNLITKILREDNIKN